MDDEDVSADIPRIGSLPPSVPPVCVDRFSMREALTMPAYIVQEVLDDLEPLLLAVLEYREMLRNVLKIRQDIEAAGARAKDNA